MPPCLWHKISFFYGVYWREDSSFDKIQFINCFITWFMYLVSYGSFIFGFFCSVLFLGLIYHTHWTSFTVTGAWPLQVQNAYYPSTLLVMTCRLSLAIINFTAMNSLITISGDTFACISLGSLVQFNRSVMSDSLWPMNCSTSGFPVHHQIPELDQTHVHWVGDAIQPSHPLLFPSPPALSLSQHQGLFQWVSPSHQVAKWLEFQLHSPSNEYSGLISFRMDWLDFLAVQGTLKSLFQHHSWKALVLWCSAFFIVQLSHPYMTTGKTIALTRWTFISSLCFLICCLGLS